MEKEDGPIAIVAMTKFSLLLQLMLLPSKRRWKTLRRGRSWIDVVGSPFLIFFFYCKTSLINCINDNSDRLRFDYSQTENCLLTPANRSTTTSPSSVGWGMNTYDFACMTLTDFQLIIVLDRSLVLSSVSSRELDECDLSIYTFSWYLLHPVNLSHHSSFQ